jgi:hypothetical protein
MDDAIGNVFAIEMRLVIDKMSILKEKWTYMNKKGEGNLSKDETN